MNFKVIWPFRLKKRHLMSLSYSDLGQPSGVTCPKHALVYAKFIDYKKHLSEFGSKHLFHMNVWCYILHSTVVRMVSILYMLVNSHPMYPI